MKTKTLLLALLTTALTSVAQVTVTNTVEIPVTVTNTIIETNVVTVTQTNIVVQTNSVALPPNSVFVAVDDKVTLPFVIPAESGSQLLSGFGVIAEGRGKYEAASDSVVLYGVCRITIPIATAEAMLVPPGGISFRKIVGEFEFKKTERGYEGAPTIAR